MKFETEIRAFLKAMQKRGYYKPDINFDTITVEEIEKLLTKFNKDSMIVSITKDSGIHYSQLSQNWDAVREDGVNEGETYITYNDMGALSGRCVTYVMVDGEITKGYLLARS